MKQIQWVFILLLATSCQFFETEKISSETFYEEDMEAIDWESVDRYPSFNQCEAFTDKKDQKECFESELTNYVYTSIAHHQIVTHRDINSTVFMELTISNQGEIKNVQIEMDSTLQKTLPLLSEWLRASVDSLPSMAPAYKQGIPVTTKFTLPVVIATN